MHKYRVVIAEPFYDKPTIVMGTIEEKPYCLVVRTANGEHRYPWARVVKYGLFGEEGFS